MFKKSHDVKVKKSLGLTYVCSTKNLDKTYKTLEYLNRSKEKQESIIYSHTLKLFNRGLSRLRRLIFLKENKGNKYVFIKKTKEFNSFINEYFGKKVKSYVIDPDNMILSVSTYDKKEKLKFNIVSMVIDEERDQGQPIEIIFSRRNY